MNEKNTQRIMQFTALFPDFEIVSQLATKLKESNYNKFLSLKEEQAGFAFSRMDSLVNEVIQKINMVKA